MDDKDKDQLVAEKERKRRIVKQSVTHKGLDPNLQKASMSVIEMGQLLGLKKTDSYYLVHKECFETKIIGGYMRVMTESFEKWYRSQFHYKKITGEPPGEKYKNTITVAEAAKQMGENVRDLYAFLNNSMDPPFKVLMVNGIKRIDKTSFTRWLSRRKEK